MGEGVTRYLPRVEQLGTALPQQVVPEVASAAHHEDPGPLGDVCRHELDLGLGGRPHAPVPNMGKVVM